MKKMWLLCFVFLTTCVFAQTWDQYFQDHDEVNFNLGKEKVLNLRIPHGFKCDFSKTTQNCFIIEFVPKEESVENWTQIYTICAYPPMKNFEEFAQRFAGPCYPVYKESLEFKYSEDIKAFCYMCETFAMKCPEFERLEDLDEVTLKFGFQGENGLVVFHACVRYDENETMDQKMKIAEDLENLVHDSFDVLE